MSKTYKDEPYWVRKKNTKKYDTYERHHHHNLGTGVTRKYRRRTYITEPASYELRERWVPVFPSEYHKLNDLTETQLFLSSGGTSTLHYYKEEYYVHHRRTQTVWEETSELITRPDRCTINEPEPDRQSLAWNYRYLAHPCTVEIQHWQLGKRESYKNRPDKFQAKIHHASRRNRHTLEARAMVKLHNAGENLEDYDYEPLHQKTYEGWWD